GCAPAGFSRDSRLPPVRSPNHDCGIVWLVSTARVDTRPCWIENRDRAIGPPDSNTCLEHAAAHGPVSNLVEHPGFEVVFEETQHAHVNRPLKAEVPIRRRVPP